MQNISGFGLRINMISIPTFPVGVTLTQFSDDSDPLDIPAIQIADGAMGLNGDLQVWSTAAKVPLTLSVIPGGTDDDALSALLQANTPRRGSPGLLDVVTMTIMMPDGAFATATNGFLKSGMPSQSVASAGRKKSKPYNFEFESIIWTFA